MHFDDCHTWACLFYAGTAGTANAGTGDAGTAVPACFRFAILCRDRKRRDSRRRDNGINVKTLLLVVLTCQIHANDIKTMCIA